ncbi:hypothetical protein BGZ68_008534 [Mortierella alpina]|nr:hypothetical protein BGZ68_008534 [Mortierella alpina]
MHQDHNIPWRTLASYFSVMEDPRRRYPDMPPDFRPLERPDQAKVFTYFSNALIKSIHEFADTERRKYPSKFQARRTGDVFSSEVIEKCNRYSFHSTRACLDDTNQKLEYWISRVKHADNQAPCYYGQDRDLATVIKVLIAENEMLPVLELASHPSLPLETLYQPDRPNCGWNQLAKYTLQVYVYINILAEFPEYCQGRYYTNLRSFQRVMKKAMCNLEPEELFHYSYLGALDEEGVWRPLEYRSFNYNELDIFGDMKRLKEYLKACFAVLYRTEMMARECGMAIPWRNLVEIALELFCNYSI